MEKPQNLLISVVVPMYNCEEYVNDLLSGFARQSFSQFEIICVNDGSTDNTLSLVKEFCKNDSRFKYIDKENGGAGSARNAGMDIATGKYIAFLDADDEYSPDWLKEMYEAAEKAQADVTICQFKFVDLLRGVTTDDAGLNAPELKTGEVVSPDDISDLFRATNPAPTNKLYLLSFLRNNGLRYTNAIVAEDFVFINSVLPLADRVVGLPKTLITVRSGLNPDSISTNRHKNATDALLAIWQLYDWLKVHGLENKYEDSFLRKSKEVVLWETNFQCQEDYIRASAEMIKNEEPWCHLPHKKRMSYWQFNLPAMEKTVDDLKKEISETGDSDTLQAKLRSATNRYESAKLLTKLLKKEDPAISVVIPMYNCEQYVESMLGAIAAQTFTDFEVICVNDGSTDNTLQLIKEFCVKDSRFTYLSQENGGAGAARNTGIDAASGKYMMFLDADDEYFPDFLREMYEATEKHNADEVFCLYDDYDYYDGTEKKSIGFSIDKLPEDTAVATESIPYLYGAVSWSVWNALLKKELIDRYSLRFSTTKAANDVFFIYAYASITETLVGVHKNLLRRRRNHNVNSITSNRWKHTEDVVSAIKELYSWIESNNLSPLYLDMCRMLFIYSMSYNCSFPFNEKYGEAVAQCLCEGDMWKGLKEDTFYKKFWKHNDTDKMRKQLSDFQAQEENVIIEAQAMSNRIHTIERIEEIAYRKYGRILNPNHYYKEIDTLKTELNKLRKENAQQKKIIAKTTDDLNIEKRSNALVRASKTYKLGQYATWLPKKVYRGGRKIKKKIVSRVTPVKVSVIIPVYNVEKYIRRCIDSLVGQTLKELEFIFVDDCGQDDSMKIVREYQQKDSRIRILKTPSNLGAGTSRNRGIEAAKGEYLAFVDPDDWVRPNAYEDLYKKALADHSDVVKGNIQITDENGQDITKNNSWFNNAFIQEGLSQSKPHYALITCAHGTMIYSKQLLSNHSIRYGSMRSAEDGVFLLNVFLNTDDVSFCDDTVYHYCMRSGGLSGLERYELHLSTLESLKERIRILNHKGRYDTHYYRYITNYCNYVLDNFKHYTEGNEQTKQEEIADYIKKLEEAIESTKDPQKVFDALPVYHELKENQR